MSELEQWDRCKPNEFTPVFYREQDPLEGRPFPDICFTLDDCGKWMRTQSLVDCAITDTCHASYGHGVSLLLHATHGHS